MALPTVISKADKVRIKIKLHQLVILANDSGERGFDLVQRLRSEWEKVYNSVVLDTYLWDAAKDLPRYDSAGTIFMGFSELIQWTPSSQSSRS